MIGMRMIVSGCLLGAIVGQSAVAQSDRATDRRAVLAAITYLEAKYDSLGPTAFGENLIRVFGPGAGDSVAAYDARSSKSLVELLQPDSEIFPRLLFTQPRRAHSVLACTTEPSQPRVPKCTGREEPGVLELGGTFVILGLRSVASDTVEIVANVTQLKETMKVIPGRAILGLTLARKDSLWRVIKDYAIVVF